MAKLSLVAFREYDGEITIASLPGFRGSSTTGLNSSNGMVYKGARSVFSANTKQQPFLINTNRTTCWREGKQGSQNGFEHR